MGNNAGTKWPWIISISVIVIIIASFATVKVALSDPDEPSDYAMQNYHEYDKNINDIIEAKIAFDRLYTIEYRGERLSQKGSIIRYGITNKDGSPVENATITVVLTRPDTTKLNITLEKPNYENGIYTFNTVDLPKAGRWDIMAKIDVAGNQRYFNLKADTRNESTIEF